MATQEQVAALKYLIVKSKDAEESAKRLLIWMINHSRRLTKRVYVDINCERGKISTQKARSIINGVDAIKSGNGNTHLNEIMKAMGSQLGFYVSGGNQYIMASLTSKMGGGKSFRIEICDADLRAVSLVDGVLYEEPAKRRRKAA